MHKGTTKLAQIIQNEALQAHEGESHDYKTLYHSCGSSKSCQLSPALEAAFAAKLAKELMRRVQATRQDWYENEILYTPHTTSEQKVGFDYSIGHFRERRRVRWMHKHAMEWCDSENWRWRAKGKEADRCGKHGALLSIQEKLGREHVRPFLVLSVCFCLHEYRRMGRIGVPSVEDPRRWVIADLRPLSAWKEDRIKAGSFRFEHNLENSRASWDTEDESVELPMVNFEQFLEEQGAFLSEGPP